MKKVTLQMIAEELNVSKSLVSKALSNDPAVNEDTRQQILSAAAAMGYQAKQGRKAAALEQTGNIAVFMPQAYLGDLDYWGKVLRGINMGLSDQGYNMILSGLDIELSPQKGLPEQINPNKVDGVIVMGHIPRTYLKALALKKLPLIMVDANDPDPEYDHIWANNYLGAYQAASYLIEAGHLRLGFVGDAGSAWSFGERRRGFEEAIRAYNATAEQQATYVLIEGLGVSGLGNYSSSRFEEALQIQLKAASHPITGIFCANDLMAYEVIKRLPDWGLSYPEDLSIVGFDDLNIAEFVKPKLTTMRVPKEEIGLRAAETILQRVREPNKTAVHLCLSTKLVERDSVVPR